MKLSACLIIKNEEDNLPICLESLRHIISEIIVVDTGSTDNSREVAKSYNAKVFDYLWDNSFSNAKNEALANATGDWVIFLDADEYLEKGSDTALIKLLHDYDKGNDIEAVTCSMKHIDKDKNVAIGRNPILRVFRNQRNIRYVGSIHEEALKGSKQLKSVYAADITIIHTGYSSSILPSKFARNLELLMKDVRDGSADAMTYYYLGGCNSGLGNFKEAIKNVKKVFEYESQNDMQIHPTIRYQLYVVILRSMFSLNKDTSVEVKDVLDEALKFYGHHPEIVRYKAVFLMKGKKVREALKCFLEAIELDKQHNRLENNDFATYLTDTYSSIGSLYAYINQEDKALEYYLKALKENKYFDDAIIRVLRLLCNENAQEILTFLLEIYDRNSYKDVEYLVDSLNKVKLPVPFAYFVKIWNAQFEQQDASIIEAMIALGKYKDAANTALVLAEQYGDKACMPLAISAIVLGSLDKTYISRVRAVNKVAYYITDLLKGSDNHFKVGNEIAAMLFETMRLVIGYAQPDTCAKYIDRAIELFDDKAAFAMIDFLILFGKLRLAQKYYKKLSETAIDTDTRKNSMFIAGFCAYRNREFNEAVALLKGAIDEGYEQYEILECLELVHSQCNDSEIKLTVDSAINKIQKQNSNDKNLHIGCGKDIKPGWINLDIVSGDGVDIVADLDRCIAEPLPLEGDSIDYFLASHVIEHIHDPLGMMEELYRIAKPNAQAIFRCPYGSSDDAFEDPTHTRQYFLNSFLYFSQPTYWRADYGYRGDWKVDRITLSLEADRVFRLDQDKVMDLIHTQRNIVREMQVEMKAIKPLRPQERTLMDQPIILFRLV